MSILNGRDNDDDHAQWRGSEGATPEAPESRLGICRSLLSRLRSDLSPSSQEWQNHVSDKDDDGDR